MGLLIFLIIAAAPGALMWHCPPSAYSVKITAIYFQQRSEITLLLIAPVAYSFFPPYPSRKLPTITMSEQKQSSVIPLPIQSPVPYRSSWKPRILLGILFLLATAINFGPSLSSVSERAKCRWGSSSYIFQDDLTTRLDMEQLKDWAKCPKQPKPIYPNMTWEMTEEERARSVEHYAQAVASSNPVRHP